MTQTSQAASGDEILVSQVALLGVTSQRRFYLLFFRLSKEA
jgi:hypothetical protein